jgi:hypothetical protein
MGAPLRESQVLRVPGKARGAKRSLSAVPAGTPLGASTPEGITWLIEKQIVQMFLCSRLQPKVTCDGPCRRKPLHTSVTPPLIEVQCTNST